MSIQLADPECPTDLWWELAAKHPLEAQASVLYPLLTLEAPERWARLESNNVETWLHAAIKQLAADTSQRLAHQLFAADCIERVLPIYEREYPHDVRVRNAIQVRRLFAQGLASFDEWTAAQQEAWRATDNATGTRRQVGATRDGPAEWAASAAGHSEAKEAIHAACIASSGNDTIIKDADWVRERSWQWQRIQLYLRGDL